jgi:hypothetical protein
LQKKVCAPCVSVRRTRFDDGGRADQVVLMEGCQPCGSSSPMWRAGRVGPPLSRVIEQRGKLSASHATTTHGFANSSSPWIGVSELGTKTDDYREELFRPADA